MLLLKSDADETMLHDPSATWSSVDRGLPVVRSCVLADASCRCPSALSGDPRVAWLAPEAGAHRGLAIMPSPHITYEIEVDRNVSGS